MDRVSKDQDDDIGDGTALSGSSKAFTWENSFRGRYLVVADTMVWAKCTQTFR